MITAIIIISGLSLIILAVGVCAVLYACDRIAKETLQGE